MRKTVEVSVLALTMSAAFGVHAQPASEKRLTPSTGKGRSTAQAPSGPAANGRGRKGETVQLTDEAELAKVVSLYEAGKYNDCATALKPLLDSKARERLRDRAVIENARIYQAACLIGSGKFEAADEPLRAAIRDNMQMKPPDALVFPSPVVERFLRVRQSLYDEIRQAEEERLRKARAEAERRLERERAESERVRELEEIATREILVIKNRRWVGLVPFGVGQFQNGNEGLGWVFLTSEAVLGATALTSLGVYTHFNREAGEYKNVDNNAVIDTWYTLFEVTSYSFLGVAALGILEAQLSFVPEFRELRTRPLPPRLRRRTSLVDVRPSVSPGPEGVMFGVTGRF